MASIVLFILGSVLHLVLSQNPQFLTNAPQVVVVKGEEAIIPCRIRDLGNHKVLWSFERVLLTFDDRRITDDDRYSVERPYQTEWNLHIGDVKKEDAGTYHCQVHTNPKMSYDVKLVVLDEAPSPVVPKEVKAFSGSDVEIKCKLPDLNEIATWSYKENENSPKRNIAEGDKFRFRSGQGQDSHEHTLVISDVKARDQGLYLCRARSGVEAKTALRVVVPPPPPTLEVKAESPNSLLVRWRQPSVSDITVAGYILYILSHRTDKEHVFDVESSKDVLGEESFRVGDLSTDTVYTVQLATKLQLGGSGVTVGKRSPGVNITTPLFVPQAPGWVKVRRVSDEEADVEWSAPAKAKMEGIIRGFHISYVPLDRKKKPIAAQEKKLKVESAAGGKWKARLKGLKPKTRYHVRVRGFTHKGLGRQSKTVTYVHKTLPPELSVNGRVLSDNSILLSLTTLGSAKMTNIRIFFTEAERPAWKRLDFSQRWKFTVVGGLEPGTSYFFKVRAKIGGKWKQCVTHMTTSPHDLQPPQNVKVSATTATSVDVTWDYVIANDKSSLPLGYIVILEETGGMHGGEGEGQKITQQSVVFNRTSTEIKDLKSGTKYSIQVTAFNGFGEGPRTESILFHIAESDVKPEHVDERFPPRFRHELPERVSVEPGEPVKITCEADGSPVPEVQWYSDGEPIGVPAQGSNQLVLAKVQKPTVLLCRASSPLGFNEVTIYVDMPTPEPVKEDDQASEGMVLNMTAENIQPTTLTLTWKLDAGDPGSVDRFQVAILNKDDRELLSRQVPPQSRTFHLHSLQPGTEYRAVITAFGGQGGKEELAVARTSAFTLNIDGSDAAPAPTHAPTPRPTAPLRTTSPPPAQRHRGQITMNIMDVLPNSASVEWGFSGLDLRHVQMFEMKVMSASNITLLTETLQPHLAIMQLSLQPDELYYIHVRAFDRRGKVLAENVTSVTTPPANATPQPPTTPSQSGPVLKKATLTLTSHAVTGDSARLDWNLAGAQQSDIGQFLMKVKDTEGRTLLRQEMTREARSLTLNNLSPHTTYVVEVEALDSRGAVLASSGTAVTTTAANALDLDSDSKKLRVFTEELDTNYVKIAWTTPPKLIPGMSGVTVRLTDIAKFSLLTQQMSSLTRSLTVRQLQPGETYFAHVQLLGSRGEVLREGTLEFTTQPTPGMPGRPEIKSARTVNNSAVRLDWITTPSPSPAPGSEDVTGYAINYASVDSNDAPLGGIYQLPVFGSEKFVVIPSLSPGKRYMFQVAARNQYSFGPLSAPAFARLPR